MSTNATITVVNRSTGKASTIYNHWDGYPEGVGKTLAEHYNSQELADALVALGNVSNLDESMEQPAGHSFNTPVKGYSVFYGRDRGEDDQEAMVQDVDTFVLDRHSYGKQEFNYMFVDGEWIRATKIPEEESTMDKVLEQLREDVINNDLSAITEMLQHVPDNILEGFLSQ